MFVSESYVLLYYEKKFICYLSMKYVLIKKQMQCTSNQIPLNVLVHQGGRGRMAVGFTTTYAISNLSPL
jgi:uncharacterized protein (DUF302 family)